MNFQNATAPRTRPRRALAAPASPEHHAPPDHRPGRPGPQAPHRPRQAPAAGPLAPAWGWKIPDGGRAVHVAAGPEYQAGTGKSALVKRLVTGAVAFGTKALIVGDTKPDYTLLAEHLGGQVIRIGR